MKVSINSGAALIIWVASFFGILFTAKVVQAVADNLILTLTALTTGMGGYLVKRNANNKITLEAEKHGLSNAKTGDPLK